MKFAPAVPYSQRPLWDCTAGPPLHAPPLRESIDRDVVIVGAGILGLSTALHLAEAGLRVCVLDAQQPAWGASGRNGGQVIPGIKHDPEKILSLYGQELGQPLLRMVATAADAVFDLVDRYRIDCDAVRSGWIQPAHSEHALEGVLDRARQWIDYGARAEILDRHALAAALGTDHFQGGWIDYRAGSIQPLRYTRGLQKVAMDAGVDIHGDTPVTALEREGNRWIARTGPGSTVRADHALIATNGYTDGLWPDLKRTVIAANSFIVATPPLDDRIGGNILPTGAVASDSRRLLLYFRRDAEGRFILGGRGHFADPTSERDWDHLVRGARLLYPQLKNQDFPYRWGGRIALTRDFTPHMHRPAPNLRIMVGFNGRGVALAKQMGRYLAREIAAGEPVPFPITPLKPIPFHGLKRLYIGLAVAYYGLCDRLV